MLVTFMNTQVQVRTWPGPGPNLVDPVQWGPGSGPEKIPRTWTGPDLGQSTCSSDMLPDFPTVRIFHSLTFAELSKISYHH